MIAKMRYVTITGPLESIDQVIEDYLLRQKIHLEYSSQRHNELKALIGENPYQEMAGNAEFLLKLIGDLDGEFPPVYFPIKGKEAIEIVSAARQYYDEQSQYFRELEAEKAQIVEDIQKVLPYRILDDYLPGLVKFKHIQCLFGHMPLENFMQFKNFVYNDSHCILIETKRSEDIVWGCFFAVAEDDIEALLAPYNFKQSEVGSRNLAELDTRLKEIDLALSQGISNGVASRIPIGIDNDKRRLITACRTVLSLHKSFSIKEYAGKTARHFVFEGWMTRSDANTFAKEVATDPFMIVNISRNFGEETPPTKLQNLPIVRYFEFFVRLYGIPKYKEIDPTGILAIFYTLLFGMMFGDVGHGIGLAFLGFVLLTNPKFSHPIGGVMIAAGLSSIFFGFMYGSIFGLEHILTAIWRRPMLDIMGTLIFAISLGAGIILLCMLLNMISAFQQKDYNRLLFSPNGLAGMLGYLLIIGTVLGYVPWFVAILPFAVVVAKGMAHQEDDENTSIGMAIFQRALGLFEIALAYLTNTVSFVRVGAFALSHAFMMHVVLTISGGMGTVGNIAVFLLGNVVVMAIEGLLIGIQSLRLGFYEIFSRFYEGGGRNFESTNENKAVVSI